MASTVSGDDGFSNMWGDSPEQDPRYSGSRPAAYWELEETLNDLLRPNERRKLINKLKKARKKIDRLQKENEILKKELLEKTNEFKKWLEV